MEEIGEAPAASAAVSLWPVGNSEFVLAGPAMPGRRNGDPLQATEKMQCNSFAVLATKTMQTWYDLVTFRQVQEWEAEPGRTAPAPVPPCPAWSAAPQCGPEPWSHGHIGQSFADSTTVSDEVGAIRNEHTRHGLQGLSPGPGLPGCAGGEQVHVGT